MIRRFVTYRLLITHRRRMVSVKDNGFNNDGISDHGPKKSTLSRRSIMDTTGFRWHSCTSTGPRREIFRRWRTTSQRVHVGFSLATPSHLRRLLSTYFYGWLTRGFLLRDITADSPKEWVESQDFLNQQDDSTYFTYWGFYGISRGKKTNTLTNDIRGKKQNFWKITLWNMKFSYIYIYMLYIFYTYKCPWVVNGILCLILPYESFRGHLVWSKCREKIEGNP